MGISLQRRIQHLRSSGKNPLSILLGNRRETFLRDFQVLIGVPSIALLIPATGSH
ncbi:hypothetical protein [Steroidobacter agaridevorans]|uniref:hypothetical protein n=1 Tax=Steroidobacter agaridevorans TaxID=2695856 RepID=UPI00137B3074|nr:hypothetical protein [Steroidobacter agaridevorans]